MNRDRYESLEYDGRLYDEMRRIESENEDLQKELKEKDKEIEKIQRQKEELQINGLRQEKLFKLKIERLNNIINNIESNIIFFYILFSRFHCIHFCIYYRTASFSP